MKRKLHVRLTPEYLRSLARRDASYIGRHGWRPSKHDLANLRTSTQDAIAYRTMARAWRSVGFQDRSHSPARQAKTKTRARVLAAGARADFPAAARCNINEDTNMSTDLTTTDDGWLDAAAEANARVLRGSLLRFNDWNWSKNKEGEPVEKGTKLVALGTAAAWARWAGGKPVEYRMRQSGKPLPDREELGNTDQSQWEMGPDGKTPRDPWQSTRLVYLVDPDTAEAFTFSTSSWGGREAVINLGDAIARMRSAHPKALPVVSLEATAMHTRYGRKSKPVFKIVDWKAAGEGVWEEQKQLPSQEPDELPY